MRLAFLVPAPDYPEPWRWAFDAEAAALSGLGIDVEAIPWTEARQLSGYNLVLPLAVWGYHLRYAEWLALLDRLEREALPVVNPPALLRWNSDKAYLAELGEKGIATVPTIERHRLDGSDLADAAARFGTDRLVIKPLISAGADGTYRIGPGDGLPVDVLGRRMIIQPWMDAVTDEGEFSLFLFDGALSHAVVKRPKQGDFRVQPHLGGSTERCEPPAGSEELARAALAAAPAEPVYARVDMLRDSEGMLRIMELELVEPALFLDLAPDGGTAFGRSIRRAAERAAK